VPAIRARLRALDPPVIRAGRPCDQRWCSRVGHGYKPLRMLMLLGALVLVGALIV